VGGPEYEYPGTPPPVSDVRESNESNALCGWGGPSLGSRDGQATRQLEVERERRASLPTTRVKIQLSFSVSCVSQAGRKAVAW
jgi:hypothetical protein